MISLMILLAAQAVPRAAVVPPDANTGQRRFERRLFAEAGFPPIAERQLEGRDVRRLLLADPYGILPIPGIELERRGGSVTAQLQYRGWRTAPITIDAAIWPRLAAEEATLFAPDPVVPAGRPSSTPPPICHGWLARIEVGYGRSASWSACDAPAVDPGGRYVRAVLAGVMATRQDCVVADDLFWSFERCFAAKQTLDDAGLEARVAPLRRRYDGAAASQTLATARNALRTPGLVLGSPAWIVVRDQVRRFRTTLDERREALRDMRLLLSSTPDLSVPDRAKLNQLVDAWTGWLRSQDGNYAELLQQLVWPKAVTAAATSAAP